MAIKSIVTADEYEALAEALKEHYEAEGDEYHLTTDRSDRARLSEFRDNNRALYKENEALKKRQDEIEQALKEVKGEANALAEKELLSEGKIDELLSQRTEAMRASYDEQIKTKADALVTAERDLDRYVIENQIRDEAIKAQAKGGAVDHIIRALRPQIKRAGATAFRVDDNGEPVMGDDGKTPQGIDSLIDELKVSDVFLFAESVGSGATGGVPVNGAAKQRIRRSEIGKYINEVDAGEVEIIDG